MPLIHFLVLLYLRIKASNYCSITWKSKSKNLYLKSVNIFLHLYLGLNVSKFINTLRKSCWDNGVRGSSSTGYLSYCGMISRSTCDPCPPPTCCAYQNSSDFQTGEGFQTGRAISPAFGDQGSAAPTWNSHPSIDHSLRHLVNYPAAHRQCSNYTDISDFSLSA